MAIIGDTETASNTVSVRTRCGEELKDISISEFITKLTDEIERKTT